MTNPAKEESIHTASDFCAKPARSGELNVKRGGWFTDGCLFSC